MEGRQAGWYRRLGNKKNTRQQRNYEIERCDRELKGCAAGMMGKVGTGVRGSIWWTAPEWQVCGVQGKYMSWKK